MAKKMARNSRITVIYMRDIHFKTEFTCLFLNLNWLSAAKMTGIIWSMYLNKHFGPSCFARASTSTRELHLAKEVNSLKLLESGK